MVIVTGGTGFIGRQLVRQLVEKHGKNHVHCLIYNKFDNELERSGRKVLDSLGVACTPVDLVTGEGLENTPKGAKTICHLASVTITAERDHSINTIGTQNLVKALKPFAPGAHFVFTSTICVNDKRDDFDQPITETLPPPERPSNEYGRKKLIAEHYLEKIAKEEQISLSVIRVTGVYGEGARPNGLFDNVEKLVKKGSILTRINWPGKISIIHVNDMARFIRTVAETPPPPGHHEVYIPSVEVYTLAEMSAIMHRIYNIPYKPVVLPNFFWNTLRFLARKKGIIEYMVPHVVYDKIWQACILVNNEFWNRSVKIFRLIPDWNPMRYADFYSGKYRKDV